MPVKYAFVTKIGNGIDAERLGAWIGDKLPGEGPFSMQRIGEATGVASALYMLERGDGRWVLRRPPAAINAPGASDIVREWRLLRALEGSAVPHPEALLLCEDLDIIGVPFMIMELVDGITPVGVLPAPYDRPEARRALSFALVDAIADLSNIDWRARGLDGFGKPEGFLERQVPRWLRQLDLYRSRDIPFLDNVTEWLEGNRPADGDPGIMHGDYSPFNVMARLDDPTKLAAVIDWDTGTVGDPLMDIGHLLARWTEEGEEPALGVMDFAQREGLPTRAELADRYAERSGRDLSGIRYYEVLSLYKLAIILEGGVKRLSETDPAASAERAALVERLMRYSWAFATGERS